MMDNLFNKNDADFCTLIDYVDTFLSKDNKYYNYFQLPPIQRNSVWNVSQIEKLWDSILRGYPIGSFLLSPRQEGSATRSLYDGKQIKSLSDGYFLLDGQQRTRSLLLGFKPNPNARIWIDLNPQLVFDNIEFNDRKFLLRVLTNYQPWGMNDQNPSEKLHEFQKLQAREKLNINHIHYDYEVKINNGTNKEQPDFFSWPIKSTLPVPLDEFINLCGGTSGFFKLPEWDSVCKLIPKRFFSESDSFKEPTEHYYEIVKAVEKLINTSDDRLKSRTVVLLFQNENKTDYVENKQDDMEVLFRRINAGGTTLQGEEMVYSLLKSSWDDAYELVSNIVNDKLIGYLLSSTGIVMLATRLTRYIQNENDIPNPSVSNFRKWIGEKGEKKTFLKTIQSLLIHDERGKSKLHRVIESFCELVIYKDNHLEDIGLPKKLLLSIKPAILHPVFIWIYENKNNKEILESNRINILRYLIYCNLTVEKHDKTSKKVIEVLKSKKGYFPDKEIYETLIENQLSVPMPSPEEFYKPFEVPADGFFRHWKEIFELPNDSYNSFRKRFWNDSKEMLLWFQREYVSKWFKGYDPTSNDAFDTPYDWDHIMPKSHLIVSGALPNLYSKNVNLNNKFNWNRANYANSIGNYRLWPFWANRKDSNKCHTQKLRICNADFMRDIDSKALQLTSEKDFFKASAISLTDKRLWEDAGGKVRDWPFKRRIAWQLSVEKRTSYLFRIMYDSFEFNKWKP